MSDSVTASDIGSSRRVLIRVVVTAIPGLVERRPTTLWEQYCTAKLDRGSGLQDGLDNVHVPGGFDLETPVKRWFLYDVDVSQSLKPEEVVDLPHHAYRAVQDGQGQLTFVDTAIGKDTVTYLAKMYDWTLAPRVELNTEA